MNCSTAISIARTATATTPNGCGKMSASTGAFLAATTAAAANSVKVVNIKAAATSPVLCPSTATIPIINNNNSTRSVSSSSSSSTTIATTGMTKNITQAAQIIAQSDVVCFDVDSTVICEEGIDELAKYCGKGEEVARITREAMGGAMTFRDALSIRLNTIRPREQQIVDFVRERPSKLTRNVKRFVEQLRAAGKTVYLISGGFDCLIAPVAEELNIPLERVYANRLLFDAATGEYADFDRSQPTSRSGGKAEAVAIIKRQQQQQQQQQQTDAAIVITMIGDGATDLEAVPPANHFIGFGGNVVRAEVFKRAQYYVTDFEQLMPVRPNGSG